MVSCLQNDEWFVRGKMNRKAAALGSVVLIAAGVLALMTSLAGAVFGYGLWQL
jgi:hypothetical protein